MRREAESLVNKAVKRLMKEKILFIFILSAFLFQADSIEAQKRRPSPKSKTLTAREIAEKVMPSVVLIITQDENGNPISQGSGFVYKPGLVVSNLHVFERATKAIVKSVTTGEISKAVEVVGMNAQQDLCIIRVDNLKFRAITIGESQSVKTGDDIYVASNPKGLEGTFTKGIISRKREGVLFEEYGKDDKSYRLAKKYGLGETKLIQFDAAISPGSSGGVLLNTKAEVIGIVRSSLVAGQNLNFAIPIDQLLSLELKFKHAILLAGAVAFSDRQKAKLKGPVKSVMEKIVDSSYAKKTPVFNRYWEYDVYGNNIKYVSFEVSPNTVTLRTVLRSFDENGFVESFTILKDDEKGAVSMNVPFIKRIETKIGLRHFSGDFAGKIYVSEGLDHDAWIISEDDFLISFDPLGNLEQSRSISPVTQKTITFTFDYNQDGLLVRGDSGGLPNYRYLYRFDKQQNWIERKVQPWLPGIGWDEEGVYRYVVREIEYF
jgi:S1-C subfamily serine protease